MSHIKAYGKTDDFPKIVNYLLSYHADVETSKVKNIHGARNL